MFYADLSITFQWLSECILNAEENVHERRVLLSALGST